MACQPRANFGFGEVAERLKAEVLKTSVGASLPWVRIPPSPPEALETEGNYRPKTLKRFKRGVCVCASVCSALAHTVGNAVVAAYQRSSMLDLRRPVLQKWADYVCGTDNVVALKRGAA